MIEKFKYEWLGISVIIFSPNTCFFSWWIKRTFDKKYNYLLHSHIISEYFVRQSRKNRAAAIFPLNPRNPFLDAQLDSGFNNSFLYKEFFSYKATHWFHHSRVLFLLFSSLIAFLFYVNTPISLNYRMNRSLFSSAESLARHHSKHLGVFARSNNFFLCNKSLWKLLASWALFIFSRNPILLFAYIKCIHTHLHILNQMEIKWKIGNK